MPSLNPLNSGNILASNVEDNPELRLALLIKCNDYPEREYAQVSGSGGLLAIG
jgi:hypothetical protein